MRNTKVKGMFSFKWLSVLNFSFSVMPNPLCQREKSSWWFIGSSGAVSGVGQARKVPGDLAGCKKDFDLLANLIYEGYLQGHILKKRLRQTAMLEAEIVRTHDRLNHILS